MNTGTFPVEDQSGQKELSIFDYLTVLITDFMRYSAKLSENKEKCSSALQLAIWRTFALHVRF